MGLPPAFSEQPPGGDVPGDGLPTLVDRDVLYRNLLLPSGAVSLECLHLRRKGSGQLIEGTLRTLLLRNGPHMRKPTRECHGRRVNSSHLRRKHGHPLFAAYAAERKAGEHFGDFVIRAGFVAPTRNGRDFHANVGARHSA